MLYRLALFGIALCVTSAIAVDPLQSYSCLYASNDTGLLGSIACGGSSCSLPCDAIHASQSALSTGQYTHKENIVATVFGRVVAGSNRTGQTHAFKISRQVQAPTESPETWFSVDEPSPIPGYTPATSTKSQVTSVVKVVGIVSDSTRPGQSHASQISDGQVQAPTESPVTSAATAVKVTTTVTVTTTNQSVMTLPKTVTLSAISPAQTSTSFVTPPTPVLPPAVLTTSVVASGAPPSSSNLRPSSDTRISQISDGQVQGPTGVASPTAGRASQISDGQLQAPPSITLPTGGLASQTSSGQVQGPPSITIPAQSRVSQISDGQLQGPPSVPAPIQSRVSQISDGQLQAPPFNALTQPTRTESSSSAINKPSSTVIVPAPLYSSWQGDGTTLVKSLGDSTYFGAVLAAFLVW